MKKSIWLAMAAAAILAANAASALGAESQAATPKQAQPSPAASPAAMKAAEARSRQERSAMCERAMQYLFSIQKDGALGESRPKAVTAAFILACLSNGIRPDDPAHGAQVSAAIDWILKNSSQSFLGGQDEPNADHALAASALNELIGTASDNAKNLDLYKKAQAVLQQSLRLQDEGVNAEYYGGWKPNETTRTNDRVLTGWFLLHLQGSSLCGLKVQKDSLSRALDFMAASQKGTDAEKKEEAGGFSVAANGLPVRSVTACGLAMMALFDSDKEKLELARKWLERNPPTWYGPHFYESNFFAARGLFRTQAQDGGEAFRRYFNKLARMLRERQEADGSFPFPPGHGGPIVSMGKGYSTAMALLILNVDRGFLPVDQ